MLIGTEHRLLRVAVEHAKDGRWSAATLGQAAWRDVGEPSAHTAGYGLVSLAVPTASAGTWRARMDVTTPLGKRFGLRGAAGGEAGWMDAAQIQTAIAHQRTATP